MRAAMALLVLLGWGWAGPARAQEPTAERPEPSAARIRRALARYRSEPSVDRVVHAALRADRRDPGRARRAAARARRRGWGPDLRVSVRRGQGRDLSLRATDSDANVSTDDDLVLQAWLRFDFDRVVFSDDEVTLMREERARREDRAELVRTVVHLYFERRRLQLERDLLERPDPERSVRILEIEALLDAFTGGAFGSMMEARDATAP